MSEIIKISGKLFKREGNGKVTEVSYDDLIVDWLIKNTPPAVDTEEISTALNLPYDTVQPKLRWMARRHRDAIKNGSKVSGVVMVKLERGEGEKGRRRHAFKWV